jgi:hypothetical protein
MTRITPTARTLRDFILVFTAEYAALLAMCKMRGETIDPIAVWPLVLLIVVIFGLYLDSPSRETGVVSRVLPEEKRRALQGSYPGAQPRSLPRRSGQF